jgi:hypothetical protein
MARLLPGQLAEIVWAETKRLGFGRPDGSGDINDVRRLVAQLAAAKEGAGFDRREALPLTTDPMYGETARGIMAIVDEAKDAQESQSRVIIWRASTDGSRPYPSTQPPPPPPWSTIAPAAIMHRLRHALPDGRIVDVFSRAPLPAGDDGPVFVNALTGTGVPRGDPLTRAGADTAAPPNPYRKLAWALGMGGIVLLVLGGVMSAWSGRSIGGARNLLATDSPPLQAQLLEKIHAFCLEGVKQLPSGPQAAACKELSLSEDKIPDGQTTAILAAAKACPGDVSRGACSTIWRAAVAVDQDQSWKSAYFPLLNSAAAYLAGPSPSAGSSSVLVPFLIIVVGIAGLVIALGLGTKQRVAGVWIDTRYRVSLARAQVTLWTVVALAGYAALTMFNIGFATFLGSAADLAGYHAFPLIPASVAAALGIAAGSPMISALILPTKDKSQLPYEIRGGDADLSKRGVPFFGAASEGLDKRDSPAQASLADVFMGEERANADTVDVSRLQNVVITITLVLGFFSILVEMTSVITAKAIFEASKDRAVFTSLPELGATFTSLLFVSHATYLVSKAHDATPPKPDSQVGSP